MQRLTNQFIPVFFFCFIASYVSASPSPPSLRSSAVNVSGTVTLYWVPPADTGANFHSYMLYRSSNAGGPFTKIDSIFTYSPGVFTDISVNANTQKYYYYLITRSD